MEISARFKPALGLAGDAANPVAGQSASPAAMAPVEAPTAVQARLEPLREKLRTLPEVDLDKVHAIKAALARGEISTEPQALARAMLARAPGGNG